MRYIIIILLFCKGVFSQTASIDTNSILIGEQVGLTISNEIKIRYKLYEESMLSKSFFSVSFVYSKSEIFNAESFLTTNVPELWPQNNVLSIIFKHQTWPCVFSTIWSFFSEL